MSETTNPYRPPIAAGSESDALRPRALFALRITLLLLLVPAALNYVCFDLVAIGQSGLSATQKWLYRTTNLSLVVAVPNVIWFLGLPLLEGLGELIRSRLAGDTDKARWREALHLSLRPAPWLALIGAVLWSLWVIGVYLLGIHFFAISLAVAVPAHLVAACFYIPLLVRWIRLARAAKRE